MIVRTLVPSASTPDGSVTTVPTASMPLIGVASGHSPLRMCVSAWLTPNALTRISTSPSPGTGSATSWICSTSGPPGLVITIARILPSSPPAARPMLFSDRSKTSAEERRPAGRRSPFRGNKRTIAQKPNGAAEPLSTGAGWGHERHNEALLGAPNSDSWLVGAGAAPRCSGQAGERGLDDRFEHRAVGARLADDHQPHPGRHQLGGLRARIDVLADLAPPLGVTQRPLRVSLQPLHVVADDRPDLGVLGRKLDRRVDHQAPHSALA